MNFQECKQIVNSVDDNFRRDLETLKAICYLKGISPSVEKALTNLLLSAFVSGEASFAKRANAMVDRACQRYGIKVYNR